MNKISNLPPKGTKDWFPEEFAVRKYIFDTWRKVCLSFGYEEYLTPIIESAEIYKAKSGEDVGGKELTVFQDRAGRELAIRPEMTPSVTRMITQIYQDTPKPIRYFSIANFFRNEKPQKGRNREFWQLNADIFGSGSINADIEIIQLAIEIMKAFGATKDKFVVYINDRELISDVVTKFLQIPEENKIEAIRLIDKFGKLSNTEFVTQLKLLGASTEDETLFVRYFQKDETCLQYVYKNYLEGSESWKRTKEIFERLKKMGYEDFVTYNPSMVRGFDYYDGMVFEVYDRRDLTKDIVGDEGIYRSLFGGGRYNGLASIFGSQSFPAVGFAPGDETTKLFLESWNLLEQLQITNYKLQIYIPLLSDNLVNDVMALAQKLRDGGKEIITGLEVQKIGKALEFADKKIFGTVAILGENEKSRGVYKLKNMESGEEEEIQM